MIARQYFNSKPNLKFSAISGISPPCFIHPHIAPECWHGSFAYLGHISWHIGTSVQLWDLLSLPRLPHATDRFVPCIAAAIPCSGDAALQWGFLRTQHQKLYQVHPHALWLRKRGRSSSATISWNGYCGCGLGRMLHSSKFLDPEFFSTGTISIIPTKCSVTSLTEVTCAVKKKFTKNSKKCEIWVFFFSSSRVWRMGMRKKREKQRGLG